MANIRTLPLMRIQTKISKQRSEKRKLAIENNYNKMIKHFLELKNAIELYGSMDPCTRKKWIKNVHCHSNHYYYQQLSTAIFVFIQLKFAM